MTAAAAIAEPAQAPDPPQDPAPAVAPTRTAHLLGVLRALIAFGKQLAATVQNLPAAEAHIDIAVRFGTYSVALILARITRGLQLAGALETRLALRENRPDPVRTAPARPTSSPKPRAPRPEPSQPQDTDPTVLPTAEEIAEKLRRHPAHVVLREICSDLGLLPSDPLYQDVEHVLMRCNGDVMALWHDARKRLSARNFIPDNVRFVWPKPQQTWEPHVPAAAAVATGPP